MDLEMEVGSHAEGFDFRVKDSSSCPQVSRMRSRRRQPKGRGNAISSNSHTSLMFRRRGIPRVSRVAVGLCQRDHACNYDYVNLFSSYSRVWHLEEETDSLSPSVCLPSIKATANLFTSRRTRRQRRQKLDLFSASSPRVSRGNCEAGASGEASPRRVNVCQSILFFALFFSSSSLTLRLPPRFLPISHTLSCRVYVCMCHPHDSPVHPA